MVWSLALDRGWPLAEFFTEQAIAVLSEPRPTSIGPLEQITSRRLVPPQQSELGPIVENKVALQYGVGSNGEEVLRWLHSEAVNEWSRSEQLERLVDSPFYQTYLAASDPFFSQTITPFDPTVPLFIVTRAGREPVGSRGLPSFSERYRNMIEPKIRTLRSWGWTVHEFGPMLKQGTSYDGGEAQRWAIENVKRECVSDS